RCKDGGLGETDPVAIALEEPGNSEPLRMIASEPGMDAVHLLEPVDEPGRRERVGAEQVQQRLGPRFGGGRVLASNQPHVGYDEGHPVRSLFIEPTEALQRILHEERHDLGEVDRFLLAIGEARHPLTLHDGLPLELDTMEHAGRMADGSDRFAGTVEGLDEGDGTRILSQVPHRAVAAGIEDRVVSRGFDVAEPRGVGQHRLGCGILLETPRQFGLALRRVADRVERWLSPFGRSERHGRPGVEQGVVRRGELLEPEAGLAARVAELVVGGQNYEDLHGGTPVHGVFPRVRLPAWRSAGRPRPFRGYTPGRSIRSPWADDDWP